MALTKKWDWQQIGIQTINLSAKKKSYESCSFGRKKYLALSQKRKKRERERKKKKNEIYTDQAPQVFFLAHSADPCMYVMCGTRVDIYTKVRAHEQNKKVH